MVEAMRRAGCDCQVVEVPHHGHTYPAEAMTDRGQSVELVFREQIRRWTGV
jgi:dipeptidyl aminopeptidase/acylaminoacyl peptidase